MNNEKTLDLDQIYRSVVEQIEQTDEPFWKNACHLIATGVFGACEAFGEPEEAELLSFFDRASRFDEDLANELGGNISAWASGLEMRGLEDSSEWREAYERALESCAPETFSKGALFVRGLAADEISKVA